MTKSPLYDALTTAALTAFGTASLIGIHHYYRRQRQPEARLKDYVVGLARLSGTQLMDTDQSYPMQRNVTKQKVATVHITTLHSHSVCWVSGVAAMPKASQSTPHKNDESNNNNNNDFGVVGIDADRQIVWQTTMPERVHDIVVQPICDRNKNNSGDKGHIQHRDVAVMGRRPSEWFWVLDSATGQVRFAIQSADNRHFYGHACYSLDGKLLYVAENDTVNLVGKIGVYDVYQGYTKVIEFDAYGIGPHELIMHPDGDTLIIANGGIKTEKASREELNLDTMQPALVYLNRHNGALLEQVSPEHNQMSIRHLAVHYDGTVVIGIQFQGDRHINVPLVLTHKRGNIELKPLLMSDHQWQRFHHYIASVAVDTEYNLVCATSPFGGCAVVFDLTTRELIEFVSIADCAGATVLTGNTNQGHGCNYNYNYDNNNDNKKPGFIISDGLGQLTTLTVIDWVNDNDSNGEKNTDSIKRIVKNSQTHAMSFDNHLQRL